jgi:hypothetical protein
MVHFKVYVATLNSNGIDPRNRRRIVVDIPVNDIDSARINPDSQCETSTRPPRRYVRPLRSVVRPFVE